MKLGGIDIGGTKIGVSVGRSDGGVRASHRFPTDRTARPEDVLGEALRWLETSASEPLDAIGVACPGPFLAAEGCFLDPPNMPAWHGFELLEFLRDRVRCPVFAMNDANALALAEWMWGAGVAADVRTLVYFTMSTGMGAGLILDGKLYEGRRGFAGEIGHWRLDAEGPVGFGKRGSVEGFLSGPGIVQVAEAEARICVQTGEASALVGGGDLTTEQVCALAGAGDAAATRVLERCARRLGQLIALLTDLLEPDMFVLGTIGTAYPELFLPIARACVRSEALPHTANDLQIEPSALADRGNQSALAIAAHGVGAA